MKIKSRIVTIEPETEFDKDLADALARYTAQLAILLNSGLKFADNFNMQITTVTTDSSAGTETAIPHTLGRVPSDFLVGSQDRAGSIFKGASAWTDENIYVQGSVASIAAKIYIF